MNLLVGLIAQEHHDSVDIAALIAENFAIHSPSVFHASNSESEISFIRLTTADIADVLESCDAVLILVDGVTGLSPVQMNLWTIASDQSIPRGVVAINSVGTRADFDEVVAIAERVLDDDILVRYMPIVSDDETVLVGQFDILTGQILSKDAHGFTTHAGDPEHMQLTFDRREDLVETLTHFSEGEALIEALSAGLPTNTPGLARAFTADDIVSVTAIDNGVGAPVIAEWLSGRVARWMPSLTVEGSIIDATDSQDRVGLGIASGIARTWGPAGHTLDCNCEFDVDTACLVMCPTIVMGQSLSELAKQAELFAPEF